MILPLPCLPGTCRFYLCSLLLGLATVGSPAQAQGFDPVIAYPTVAGTRPYGLALSDINGDGRLDIVAGDNNANIHTTSILLGQPGGSFGTATAYPSVPGSWDLAVTDVNLDGRPDLVTGCNGVAQAALQLGQPGGGFGALTTYQTGGGIVQGIAVGDVTGDGLPDLVVADMGNSTVNLLRGQAGGFAPTPITRYSMGPNSSPFAVALGDLNGDGRLDIVVGNAKSSTIGVLQGQAGGFAPLVTYSAFRNGSSGNFIPFLGMALADVNADSRLDVVVTTQDTLSSATLGVLLGQPGGLGPITYYPAGGLLSNSVAVGDVNADTWPDLVLASPRANSVGVFLGYPGGFSAPFLYFTGTGTVPYAVKLGDVNNDGRPDIVTTNSATSSVGVLLNATPAPLTLTSPSPSSGALGSTISLAGSNLQGAVAVVFEGAGTRSVSSGFAVNAAGTQITGVVVPSGAASGRVRVVTPNGTVTSTTDFSVLTPTAAQSATPASGLALHPSPAQTSATLTLAAGPSARAVVVVDALGRVVRQQTLPAQSGTLVLDLARLQPGLYTVRCGAATARLVID
ncbi:FG-GAP-like repeat-containing protein [Hymenobacter convexus]|uniref:FG-GAP-like repeat-containing protein n=1 Tax=Hymenobacter sp. CA1UV-4 TaxID=3063782 RepID=UPI0027127899|nr:FG-GAP-like repeat-containing protein [Hymenobacter sp. CA1UV-4]MDO7852720.1 FG-GAP-like repeat-containing protein [Hymenobacter sp. CA1UV-4]